jgi:hypothetical protein
MNNTIRLGLAAAAVVVIAFVGYQLLSGQNVVGPGPSPSTSEAPSAAPSVPGLPGTVMSPEMLTPGTYSVRPEILAAPRVEVTVPAGWNGFGVGISKDDSTSPAAGVGITFWGGPMYVYEDPCRWESSRPSAPVGPSVDEMVVALSAQAMRNATPPTDITVDGFGGKAIELTVPADIAFDPVDGFVDCDGRLEFRSWILEEGLSSYSLQAAPGQHDQLWIIDVNGARVIIDASFFEATSAADMAELQAVLESIRFER